MDIIEKFKEIVTKNNKIISTRLNEKYFISSGNGDTWKLFMEATKNLHATYVSISDILVASQVSTDILLCFTCNINPRMITRCDVTYKKILSKYCCSKCASKSPEKVDKLKHSLTEEKKEQAKIKRKNTMKKKYGVEYNTQRSDIIPRPRFPPNIQNKLDDKEWLIEEYKTKSLTQIANEVGVYYGTISEYLLKYGETIRPSTNNSFEQHQIKLFLDEIGVIYQENNTDILKPKHLDFYIPKYNLAIEWNGDYYHTEQYRQADYHYDKWQGCNNKGIKLLQFYNRDMYTKFEVMKSIIRYHTIGVEKIPARKCTVKEISNKESIDFQEENHIQGGISAEYNHGLFYRDELVAVMTWGKPRFTNKHDLELYRFCNKINTTVIGGASKLLKYFENNVKVNSVVSYCSLDRSQGNLYKTLGFTLEETEKSYFWIKSGKRLSRQATTKPKIKAMFPDEYIDSETQDENMRRLGWSKVYPAGNYVFTKTY